MRTFGFIMAAVCLFVVLAVVGETCHVAGTAVNSVNGVIDNTLDPNNVIYNYEYFKQSYQDINALSAKITDARAAATSFDAQFKNRHDMDREDKTESDRLHAVVLGLEQERQSEVATYNARAQMANRDIFKTRELPSHID